MFFVVIVIRRVERVSLSTAIGRESADLMSLVCRVAKTLLVEVEDQVVLEGEVDLDEADKEMFGIVNVGGTGNMMMEEFVGYFGAQVDDMDLAAKFEL